MRTKRRIIVGTTLGVPGALGDILGDVPALCATLGRNGNNVLGDYQSPIRDVLGESLGSVIVTLPRRAAPNVPYLGIAT